ncbi:MAG: hypothetical protein ACI8W7_000198 [Gammaproteobacteria bacterium]|jgi:hypothetical protein
MRLYVTALAALLLLGGCTSSQYSPSGDASAARFTGEVQVLEQLPATGSYEMLGIIIVRGVALTSEGRMFEQLKARAAAQGADAVVPQGPIRSQDNSQGGTDQRLAGYAIRRK